LLLLHPETAQKLPIPPQSDLAARSVADEVMDQPGLDPVEHLRALRGLARLNRISGSARSIWRALAGFATTKRSPLRILDLASGGGDLLLNLGRRAIRRGMEFDMLGVDFSPQAVEISRKAAQRANLSARFEVLNALEDSLPQGFDVVMTSLFLHHLSAEQAGRLLAKMAAAANKMVLVSDLVRGRWNLGLVALGARLVTTSRVVWTDASLSVRAAFTPMELQKLAEAAGLQGAVITKQFPCRMLMQWSKP
jgi:2-polyprenyl-3-methyl-5-hydroxy-6-metoxy-1,4-benzoquinol methylase